VDQAQYIYQRLWRSQDVMKEISLSKQYPIESLVVSFLTWLAKTLDSSDAVVLSWPDAEGLMTIQEPAFINTPALKECKTLSCFGRLREWLDSEDGGAWACGDTSKVPELRDVHVESLIVTKVFATGEEEFQGKELVVVCNRASPALEGNMYVGYDGWFCGIAQWVLGLYISDLYKLELRRYKDAKRRYEDTRIASSLILVGETAEKLLDLYDRYCARPPMLLLYDCLNAHVALFNARQIDEDKLRVVLDKCGKRWRTGVQESPSEDSDLVRCALARGYFVLGIQESGAWIKGTELLS
jgi:hypothetical protein